MIQGRYILNTERFDAIQYNMMQSDTVLNIYLM